MDSLPIVGLVEKVRISGKKDVEAYALFDSGARTTSMDTTLASKAQLGPVTRMARVKVASKKEEVSRPMVKAIIEVNGRRFDTEVNLQDRSHMTFPVIVGRNVISGNFLIDSQKNAHLFKRKLREEHVQM